MILKGEPSISINVYRLTQRQGKYLTESSLRRLRSELIQHLYLDEAPSRIRYRCPGFGFM